MHWETKNLWRALLCFLLCSCGLEPNPQYLWGMPICIYESCYIGRKANQIPLWKATRKGVSGEVYNGLKTLVLVYSFHIVLSTDSCRLEDDCFLCALPCWAGRCCCCQLGRCMSDRSLWAAGPPPHPWLRIPTCPRCLFNYWVIKEGV